MPVNIKINNLGANKIKPLRMMLENIVPVIDIATKMAAITCKL